MSIKYKCNQDYFEVIDTEEKAYWLGFLYADGCIEKDRKYLSIGLSPVDFTHLKLFNQALNSTYMIKSYENNRYIKLKICNKKIGTDLEKLGCVPAKSNILTFPNKEQVPTHLIRHFIRGYFDGDGCITLSSASTSNYQTYMNSRINILGTKNFLEGIITNLPFEDIKVNLKSGYKIYEINIYKKESILKIMDYFYKDSSIYLQRKYDRFLLVKDYVENSSYNYKVS